MRKNALSAVETLTDQELSLLLRNSDDAAFTEIYNRYWEFLYQAAHAVLKDSDACDDIVQEIFVWLWSNREKQITDAYKPYLYAAVKYKIANFLRHGKVKNEFFTRSLKKSKEVLADENSIEVNELKVILAEFTDKLPDRARMIFKLSRNEFLSNKEIAEKMGITEKTVENQINISLKKLKVSLGKMSFWSIFL